MDILWKGKTMRKILKTIGLAALVLFGISFIINAYNGSPGVIINRVFNNKEIKPQVLVYRIYALGMLPVGEAVFYNAKLEKLNREEVYHLKAEASTLGLIAPFFKARADLDSYINPVDYNPVLFKQKISVSGKSIGDDREVSYNQKSGFVTLKGVKREILPNTQDPLSLMYNLKKMDFDKTKDVEFSINTNQKNYVLKGTVEKNRVGVGKYNVYRGKSDIRRRDKNNPYHRSQVTMWFVKEGENIPVLIKVFASGFLITVRLTEVK